MKQKVITYLLNTVAIAVIMHGTLNMMKENTNFSMINVNLSNNIAYQPQSKAADRAGN